MMRRSTALLFQLCGEVLLAGVPERQPPVVRSGTATGLELLDLLLNPQHVLRITEEVTLRNTWVLTRRVQLDVSLDRLSRQGEEGAMQLSSLVRGETGEGNGAGPTGATGATGALDPTGRTGAGGADGARSQVGEERLWLPLDTVPRPVSVSIAVTGNDGCPLPRPPQREVRLTLEAGLYHILRESLRAHPHHDVDGTAINTMMRHDERAYWLLQAAMLSVCEHGPGSARSTERLRAVHRRLPDDVGLTGSGAGGDIDERALLDKLAKDETYDAAHRTALAVLRDALTGDDAFLDLVDLVHRHHFVVAGLDRRVREQSLQFELPASEALDSSIVKRVDQRIRRMLDPREHNYSVRLWIPLPENIRQYNLHVRTPAEPGEDAYSEVSLIGAIRFDDHPGRTAIEALATCAEELARTVTDAEVDDPCPDGDTGRSGDVGAAGTGAGDQTGAAVATAGGCEPVPSIAELSAGFVGSRALRALDRLGALVDLQERAGDELAVRWAHTSASSVLQPVQRLREVTAHARRQIQAARARLVEVIDLASGTGPGTSPSPDGSSDAGPGSGPGGRRDRADDMRDHTERATAALHVAADAAEHPLLAMQLVSSELPGQQVARIRIGRSMLASRIAPRPRVLEVWATVSDEARPYAFSAVVPPLVLAAMVYAVGALLFDTLTWPVRSGDGLRQVLATGVADAVVAVLLLVPAFALAQFRVPGRWSLAGRLRAPAWVFVLVAVVTLGATAVVGATQVGRAHGHPSLVLWTFRAALGVFLLWAAWEKVASSLRAAYAWRPKGLEPVFGSDVTSPVGPTDPTDPADTAVRARMQAYLHRNFGYGSKEPDAVFDLALPTRSFPVTEAGEPGDPGRPGELGDVGEMVEPVGEVEL